VTDATGKTVKTLDYDSYGKRTPAGETGADFELPIGFAGGLEDPLTGLTRFGMRDYDAAAGRWTSRDPILHDGGLNVYVYSDGNPVSQRDPSGLDEGGGATGDFGGDAGGGEAPSGSSFSNFVNAVKDFFTEGEGSTAVEVLSTVEDDSSTITQSAKQLQDGMDKVELVQDTLDTALEVKEALDKPTDLEQTGGIFKACLKWVKKGLPIDIIGIDAAGEAYNQLEPHAIHQRDHGTINRGQAAALEAAMRGERN